MRRIILRTVGLAMAFIITTFSAYNYSKTRDINQRLISEIDNIINNKRDYNRDIQENHAYDERKDKTEKKDKIKDFTTSKTYKNGDKSEELSVFKVDRYSLLSSITMKEKLKILSILSFNLNGSEIKKIYSMLNDNKSSDIEIVKKFNSYLKDRLKDDDYKELRKLAEKYINLSLVE